MHEGVNVAEDLKHLLVPIDSLNPDPSNARRHGDKNLAAIKSSLATFGQRKPIVVQKQGRIVRAGNGTLQAAKALGWTEIAAVVIDDDNATASRFAIADNRTAEMAAWDDDVLAFELERFPDLQEMWDHEDLEEDEDVDIQEMDTKPPARLVWLVALMPSEDEANKFREDLETIGAKVAIGVRR